MNKKKEQSTRELMGIRELTDYTVYAPIETRIWYFS